MGRADLDMVEAALEAGLLLDKRHWLALIAELRVARTQLGWVRELLAASPVGPTRAEATSTLFQIRQAMTDDRHVQHLDDPGSERDGE